MNGRRRRRRRRRRLLTERRRHTTDSLVGSQKCLGNNNTTAASQQPTDSSGAVSWRQQQSACGSLSGIRCDTSWSARLLMDDLCRAEYYSGRSQGPGITEDTCLEDIVCVEDFEHLARLKVSKPAYDYIFWGSDDNRTLVRNRRAIRDRYLLVPRLMRDVAEIDLSKYIFGDRLSLPIGVSPSAMHKQVHPDGELGMVRACNSMNAVMIHSIFSNSRIEDVAKAAPLCIKWQNIYIFKDRHLMQTNIDLAVRFGYRALVVTCDAPVLGHRRHDTRNRFKISTELENLKGSESVSLKEHSSDIFSMSVTWADLAELKKSVGDTVRIIAKGIMSVDDAELALAAGVDALLVSNHGGRQLDGAPATIEVLGPIVRAVNRRCPVFVDGGFRTGADILVALALGADMVFVARPALFGLACFGEQGAHRCLELLRDELVTAMRLCGCRNLDEVAALNLTSAYLGYLEAVCGFQLEALLRHRPPAALAS